jgi:bacillithiol biosynthesis deacetylase BshB2
MSTLVAVFAHPDDETFICGGTLAKYASLGKRVVLVCATKGEMGRRMGVPPVATRETIPTLREAELRRATEALGLADLHFLGIRDKTLEIQPFDELVQCVLEHLELEQPEVVVTFHEQFGGHPDHCTIGAATTRAYDIYRHQHPDARLYFVAWGGMYDRANESGIPKEQFVRVDVSAYLQPKLAAYRAHRTQSELMDWLWKRDEIAVKKLAHTEYFLQYDVPYRAGAAELFS